MNDRQVGKRHAMDVWHFTAVASSLIGSEFHTAN